MPSVKLLLVDDHDAVRGAFAALLRSESGLTVVAAVGTADEAVEEALLHRPDVILMDIDMPGRDSFDAAGAITAQLPDVRIIFLSGHIHDHYGDAALEIGAHGYVAKTESPDALLTAIRRVVAGKTYFSREVEERMVVDDSHVRLAPTIQSRAATLTHRETEVLRYIARGLSKKQIAAAMHVSIHTVSKHADNLMTKLDLHDRVELARFAIREGFVQA